MTQQSDALVAEPLRQEITAEVCAQVAHDGSLSSSVARLN